MANQSLRLISGGSMVDPPMPIRDKDAAKVLYDVTRVLQECNAVRWFNEDVIKVLQGCIIV